MTDHERQNRDIKKSCYGQLWTALVFMMYINIIINNIIENEGTLKLWNQNYVF